MRASANTAFALGLLLLALEPEAAAVHVEAAADPAVDHAIPPDYVTLFPSWQRGFIVDDRLIHAAGEDGILLALFSTAMDGPPGRESRVLLPFTHLDSGVRVPGRPGPSPRNSIRPDLPPLLHAWDVDQEHVLLVFARMRPDHDYRARLYKLSSIGGPAVEVPSASRVGSPGGIRQDIDDYLWTDLDLLGTVRNSWAKTIPDAMLALNPEMHFSLRLMPGRRLELLTQRLGFPLLLFVQRPPDRTREGAVQHWPDYQPEPFHHVVLGEEYFILRASGPLARVPESILEPMDARQMNERSMNYILNRSDFSHLESGDPLDPVADYSGIPDWVASEPSTHFMVQDRNADKVRFFWGVSGYAELEVLEAGAAGDGDREQEVRVRFQQLPAPPEMEQVRWLLLNPPEFERPEVYYEPFEGDR